MTPFLSYTLAELPLGDTGSFCIQRSLAVKERFHFLKWNETFKGNNGIAIIKGGDSSINNKTIGSPGHLQAK